VKMNTRLDNRVFDLRVPTTQAIFKLQSGVAHLFREYLDSQNFIEIHSPKLIGGASEGGSNVFKFKYFNQDACLAQSPQLYKQMCIISDFKRVYEIGPVFRAENSFTSRHLCEFTGLDIEMEIKEHFFEVLDVLGELFYFIFKGLNERYAKELEIVNNQYPFEPLVLTPEVLKLPWSEGIKLLTENGFKQDINEDLDTENEKALGKLVKDKYKTDFYILYGYPKSARPFYTMPDPKDDNFTNSFDAFIRGEEILSGAQRIHDYDLLLQKVKEKEINPETLSDYLNAFKLGAPAHGGAGIGLERVVKLFVGLGNIKKCVLFPRDSSDLALFHEFGDFIRKIKRIKVIARILIFLEKRVFDTLMSLLYLLAVYSQCCGIHDSRIKPYAQTGIIVRRNRIAVTDLEACRTFGNPRTTFLQDGIFGNFPIERVIRSIIIVGTGEEKCCKSRYEIKF
ncbi:aspartate--tRNA(Asn) ligase, partial [Fibrobacter sp.]|uniref:aspartate--tRNA(Asn) ligase n=1 Tax=Fibrobacter sp. TaxID=35828 RepID=UPI0025C574AD